MNWCNGYCKKHAGDPPVEEKSKRLKKSLKKPKKKKVPRESEGTRGRSRKVAEPEYVDGDQELQDEEEGGEEESQNSSTTNHSGCGEENHLDWSQERAMPLEVNPPVDPGDIFISEK